MKLKKIIFLKYLLIYSIDAAVEESESMDVDPNYDPSDFLGGLKRTGGETRVEEDLAVSESEDEMHVDIKQEMLQVKSEPLQNELPSEPDDDGALWF